MSQSPSQPNQISAPVSRDRNAFVGRQREMAELRSALEDTLAGQGRIVMLVGEPGIGKTRTAQELASYAQQRGARVLWGWCYEEGGAPPYWPWVQPIRAYVQQSVPDQLRLEMGPGAADIAEIVPEIRAKLTGLESPPELEPEQARFRLFDSITTFLKNAAQSQPLMLVLDDLHWADKPSLLLLQFLARELAPAQSGRLLVVGTYRDVELSRQHPLSETLAQLSRSAGGGFQRVLLRGLDQEDAAQLIQASAGIEPTTVLVEALYTHTEGNPFFMTEVIRLLSESGELTAEHIGTPQGLRIPEGVREVIGQRLNRLTEHCNEVLTTASIIGREFDFRLLNILGGEMSEDQSLQAVDEAVSFNLIEDVPGQLDRYQFSHALIQQTLAEELTTSRRVRLHARIAEALEDLYGDDGEAHAAELAHHFAEAEAVTGTEKLGHYSRLAGEQALAAYAHEEAVVHFERALVAKGVPLEGTEPATDEETAELLFGLGRARVATVPSYIIGEAVDILGRAFVYYADSGDFSRAVAIAEVPMRGPAMDYFGRASQVWGDGFIPRALELVPHDSVEAGRLWARLGFERGGIGDDYAGAQDAFSRALAIARHHGEVGMESRILADAADVDYSHLRQHECAEKSLQSVELARKVGDWHTEAIAHSTGAMSLRIIGEPMRAREQARAMLTLAERLHNRTLQLNALMFDLMVSMLLGDWQTGSEAGVRSLRRDGFEEAGRDLPGGNGRVRHRGYRHSPPYRTS